MTEGQSLGRFSERSRRRKRATKAAKLGSRNRKYLDILYNKS